jgi:hypothetical protein
VQVVGGRVVDGRVALREHDHVRDTVGHDALDQRHRLGPPDLVRHRRGREQHAAAQRQQGKRRVVVGNRMT